MRYGVIGGGALGFTVALRLAQRGFDVTILEREAVPGGLARSFEPEPGIWLFDPARRATRETPGFVNG